MENKVRDKLASVIRNQRMNCDIGSLQQQHEYSYADAILQSTDLLVTIAPKHRVVYRAAQFYYATSVHPLYYVESNCRVMGCFEREADASEYAEFLNSKEPK